jgi:Carbonic anhydrases/acetyltransferases, isoleucine patch superfamily
MIHSFRNIRPNINQQCFIAEGAQIVGNVTIEKNCSIWYGAVLRGDDNFIKIGEGSNVQDNCVLHVSNSDKPTIIGQYVTIGHGAIIHGAVIEDNCLIGMGSIIMDGCKIGKNSLVAAGSLVTGETEIPAGVLCMGSPAKVIRKLSGEEIIKIEESAKHYINLWKNK